MIIDALIYKYGYHSGFLSVDGVITEWHETLERKTDEEIQAAVDEYKIYKKWLDGLSSLDKYIPRYLEDVIDAMSDEDRSNIADFTLEKYAAKKALRAEKP